MVTGCVPLLIYPSLQPLPPQFELAKPFLVLLYSRLELALPSLFSFQVHYGINQLLLSIGKLF